VPMMRWLTDSEKLVRLSSSAKRPPFIPRMPSL
jgi:hypothetical protein